VTIAGWPPRFSRKSKMIASALAIKKRQTREKVAGLQEMDTIRCDSCGEEFIIGHRRALADKTTAERPQVGSKRFQRKHERGRDKKKHPDRIELPD
jgi:hypothetical protein